MFLDMDVGDDLARSVERIPGQGTFRRASDVRRSTPANNRHPSWQKSAFWFLHHLQTFLRRFWRRSARNIGIGFRAGCAGSAAIVEYAEAVALLPGAPNRAVRRQRTVKRCAFHPLFRGSSSARTDFTQVDYLSERFPGCAGPRFLPSARRSLWAACTFLHRSRGASCSFIEQFRLHIESARKHHVAAQR